MNFDGIIISKRQRCRMSTNLYCMFHKYDKNGSSSVHVISKNKMLCVDEVRTYNKYLHVFLIYDFLNEKRHFILFCAMVTMIIDRRSVDIHIECVFAAIHMYTYVLILVRVLKPLSISSSILSISFDKLI